MNLAERIGFTTEPSPVAVDPWRVQLFCRAIGEPPPRPDDPVPPTFLKAIETEHFASAALLKELGLPLRGVLHAEQSFEHRAPVRAGDTVTVQRKLAEVQVKKDGALTFLVVDSDYRSASQQVATSRQTILLRRLEERAA